MSEVPFDLAFYDKVWDTTMQNVFFTLFFGVLAMASLHWGENWRATESKKIWGRFIGLLGAVLCVGAAYLLRTDYAGGGVLLVLVMYGLRNQRMWMCLAGYAAMCLAMMESWCFPAFFLIPKYNGEKGKSLKYFFYVFYPAHLLVLAGIRILCL